MWVRHTNTTLRLNAETSSYSTSTNTFLKFILKDPVSEGNLWKNWSLNVLFQDTPAPWGETTGESQGHNWEQDIMLNIAYLTQLLFHSEEMETVLDVRNESDSRGCWEWKHAILNVTLPQNRRESNFCRKNYILDKNQMYCLCLSPKKWKN